MKSILFVCMGNICRSPVVEAVARAQFARAGMSIRIESAGLENYHVGQPADRRAIASAGAHGYDLSAHRARRIDATMLGAFEHVLVMDRHNLRELRDIGMPQLQHVQLFLPFAGVDGASEVPDPYYGGASDFERVIELAEAGVRGLISRAAMAHNAGMQTGSKIA